MKKRFLWGVLGIILILTLTPDIRADETATTYPIMQPDEETLFRWIEEYENSPEAYIDQDLEFSIPFRGSLSLLSHLQYTPSQRNQSSCGNCWVWACTGVMGIALNVQEGISDRLSTQYLNSCYGTGNDYACCGGTPTKFTTYYTGTGKTIPWTNTNANFQDGSGPCPGSSPIPCASVATSPNYPITSISAQKITTQGVTQTQAIANIKNVLHQNKAVYFGFYLSTSADWTNFFNFWNNQAESAVWNPNYSCGHTWVDGQGGGHAVLCVGYNDDDPNNSYWIMLNSWGTPSGRPNGLFHLDMDMDYSCTFNYFGSNLYSFDWQTLDVQFNIAGQVIYVNPSGFCGGKTPCYTTIQAAVNAATTGTTIKIVGGVLNEDVILNSSKTLILKGGYDPTFTNQTSMTTINSLTISNGTIIADHIILQPPGTTTTTTVSPTTTTTIPTTTTTVPITTTTVSTTTTTTPSGGSEVWICTEANCSTINFTFGGVPSPVYLQCGRLLHYYNIPAGTYNWSASGCGITWSGTMSVNGTSSYKLTLCPAPGGACCPSGCGTGGAYVCSTCGGGTTTTTTPTSTTTTIGPTTTTTTTPSGGSEVWFCTEANCSTISVTFGGHPAGVYLYCGRQLRYYNIPNGTYSWTATGCGMTWSGTKTVTGGSYWITLCPAPGGPCCPSGCGSGGAHVCQSCY